jgi:hypothetical protein
MTPFVILGCAVMAFCYGALAREQWSKGGRGFAALSALTVLVWVGVGVVQLL